MDGGDRHDEEVHGVARRDQPVPPPWAGPHYELASPWIGRPGPRRPISRSRALIVGALILFLVLQAAGLVIAYVDTPAQALASLALGAVYLAVVELAPWWAVSWLVARR